MTDPFEVTWQVDDGYASGSRPQRFEVDVSEVEGLDDDGLRKLFWDLIQEQFEQNASPYSQDESRFIEWAKGLEGDK